MKDFEKLYKKAEKRAAETGQDTPIKKQLQTIYLSIVEKKSEKDIASILGIAQQTVSKRIKKFYEKYPNAKPTAQDDLECVNQKDLEWDYEEDVARYSIIKLLRKRISDSQKNKK